MCEAAAAAAVSGGYRLALDDDPICDSSQNSSACVSIAQMVRMPCLVSRGEWMDKTG